MRTGRFELSAHGGLANLGLVVADDQLLDQRTVSGDARS
jgi:hypothetical protein